MNVTVSHVAVAPGPRDLVSESLVSTILPRFTALLLGASLAAWLCLAPMALADEAPAADPQTVPTRVPATPASEPAVPAAQAPEAAPADAREADREVVVITGRSLDPAQDYKVDPDRLSPASPDAADFVSLIPGAAVVDNGPIVGQVQYRGLFGPRMAVTVGTTRIDPGGPNWMDPPMQYAPRSLLESVELTRGIAPVSAGSETLGGHARAVLKTSEFADEGESEWSGSVDLGGRSADASFSTGGIVSFATDSQRAHVLGSYDFGNDYRTPDGRVRPTEFERASYGAGYGFRVADQAFGVDYRHQDVNDTGTPALPMDVRFTDSELVGATYDGTLGVFELDGGFSWNDVEHRMDNYSLRTAPPPAMQRYSKARGKNYEYDFSVSYPAYDGELEVGTDGFFARHDQYIYSPVSPAFFVHNFNDSARDRYGVFFEWTGQPVERVELDLGFRYTRVNMDSGSVDSTPSQLLPPAMRLRNGFNASDREESDNQFDFVAEVAYEPIDGLRLDLAGGRKTRSPYYIERYAWLPLDVSAGLADGNNYVGRIGLDPEVSYEIEGGVAWTWEWLHVAPRAYYRKVNDYIQGTPATNPDVIAVSTLNGDPTPLQFNNVEAELYGVDAEVVIDLPLDFVLDGTVSWVRGKRRDINDNLFRIAPVMGRTTLSYQRDTWSISIEGVYAGAQDHVSRTNGEATSKRYAIMNLFGAWDFAEGWRLSGGVDNVTNNLYRPHLAGVNRAAGSSVNVGQRLPGLGVNVYGRIAYTF